MVFKLFKSKQPCILAAVWEYALIAAMLLFLTLQKEVLPMQDQNPIPVPPPNNCWITAAVGSMKEFLFLDDLEYELLLFFSVDTYVYRKQTSVPYLLLIAQPDTGKTTALNILSRLVYRPMFVSFSTHAATRRNIRRIKGTLLMDEWYNKKNYTLEDIFRAGYKKRGGVFTIGEKDTKREDGTVRKDQTRNYNCFCPKVVASIEQIAEAALRTRFIPVAMKRTTIPLKQPNGEWLPIARQIQAEIEAFARQHRAQILATIPTICPPELPPSRILELWRPILAISKLADNRYNSGQSIFYAHMLHLAKAHASKYRIDTIVENRELSFVSLILHYTTQNQPAVEDYYRLDHIRHFLLQQDKYKYRNWHEEYISLRLNRLGLILAYKRPRVCEGRTGEEHYVQRSSVVLNIPKLQSIIDALSVS